MEVLMSRGAALIFILLAWTLSFVVNPVLADDIIAEWDKVTAPGVPELQAVTVDPSSTALLILDIEERTYQKRRPRCLDTVPRIASLLEQARAKKNDGCLLSHRERNPPDNSVGSKTPGQ